MQTPNQLANLKLWKPGQSANPGGKPTAARNLLSRKLIETLRDDFDKFGAEAICEVREKDPSTYLRVIASIVPKELTINEGETAVERILAGIPDAELASFVEGVRLLAIACGGTEDTNKAGHETELTEVHPGVFE